MHELNWSSFFQTNIVVRSKKILRGLMKVSEIFSLRDFQIYAYTYFWSYI